MKPITRIFKNPASCFYQVVLYTVLVPGNEKFYKGLKLSLHDSHDCFVILELNMLCVQINLL